MTEQIAESVETAPAEALGAGRYRVLVISAGRGSSGFYPADTLREAATKRLVTRGTHSYIDHPSASEDRDRPERSVRDLAGVFTSDAVWDEGLQGLVAEMQVLSPFRPLFAEMAEHVGLSIRGDGEIEMREGERTVTALHHISSVDVVTRAGRGGRVLELLESARPAFDAADMAATAGVTNDVPAAVAEALPPDTHKEAPVAELSEAEVTALRSSLAEAEAARDAARAEAATAKTQLAEALARVAARPRVAAKVAESTVLGAGHKAQVVESVVAALPVVDGQVADEALTAAVESAVTAAEALAAEYRTPAPQIGSLFGTFGAQLTESTGATGADINIDEVVGSAFGRTGA